MKRLYKVVVETDKGETLTQMIIANSNREILKNKNESDTILACIDRTPKINVDRLATVLTEADYTENEISYILSMFN